MDNLADKCIEKFGNESQIYTTVEELAELQKELMKFANRKSLNRKNILEEYVDVSFMLSQVKKIFNFTESEIKDMEATKSKKIGELLGNGN